jgi:hypothetical protein
MDVLGVKIPVRVRDGFRCWTPVRAIAVRASRGKLEARKPSNPAVWRVTDAIEFPPAGPIGYTIAITMFVSCSRRAVSNRESNMSACFIGPRRKKFQHMDREPDDSANLVAPQSALDSLQFAPNELAALRRQGFVTAEPRTANTTVFKLRFRIEWRQRVRYLGTDAKFAAAVENELNVHRRSQRQARELRALAIQAKAMLRNGKRRLVADLDKVGYRFHGHALRRSRKPIANDTGDQSMMSEGRSI